MRTEQLKRWRLVLGQSAEPALTSDGFDKNDKAIDDALAALYEPDLNTSLKGRGGLEKSAPRIARWLGDIRTYFPQSVVKVLQQDALDRLQLTAMLTQPEILETVTPDVHMVASLISLNRVIPETTKATARSVVRKVVDDLVKKLEEPMRQAVTGALNRAVRNNRPRHAEIDWQRTIKANLAHYQPAYRTVIPNRLIGYGRKAQRSQKDIILCIDQSGSMASSVVYSSIFGAVLASLPVVKTHLVVFDTQIVDMTEQLDDPVDVLFGVQLGGGTDINGAVAYCQTLVREPSNTILVLISDLFEGGVEQELLRRSNELMQSGVQMITLLALSDDGRPSYDAALGAKLAALGSPAFACTPDQFPDLMAAAIRRDDINLWAAKQGISTTRAKV
jgi:Mg-chelatase subunit ChlD